MVDAICEEIVLQRRYLPSHKIQTIYFGGGTPSLLTETELVEILNTVHGIYSVEKEAEITFEANPDDLTAATVKMLKQYVNRLSIGIQSFDDEFLKFMNRAHTANESENCVKIAQDVGFENISVDLIYGYDGVFSKPQIALSATNSPKENDRWQTDLDKALALNVPHISAYSLTIEDKTTLGNWLKKGKIKPTDDHLSSSQFETMVQFLTSNGYEHYEISNFAKPNRYSKHNSSYWKRLPYLGIGPSAHSYNGTTRQFNVANNGLYVKSIQEDLIPCEIEELTATDQANDYLLTSLRTVWGCELSILDKIIERDFYEIQEATIQRFVKEKWLVVKKGAMYLSPKGKLFADRITADLFLEA